MKAATLSELKRELNELPPKQVVELCLRLTRYKKENKELLTYLLFEADDEQAYVNAIRQEITDQFEMLNSSNIYLAKKGIRKILRMAGKFIKYSGNKQTEAEVLIHFCKELKATGIRIHRYLDLSNLYDRQLEKIRKAVATLHEDLQWDYKGEIENL
ncbi:MAG TPA: hypothetical protein VEC12_05360 [Bacteroidia bacterium]|nr:hypothetical protein [Bacteroidia bacterium]